MKEIPNFPEYLITKDGRVYSTKTYQWRKARKNKSGYMYIDLYKDGKKYTKRVHRLVLETYVNDCNLDVNHKDGNKLNNNLENLEYCTRSENLVHAFQNKIAKGTGPTHYKAKLSAIEVKVIRELLAPIFNFTEIAKLYRVSRTTISDLIKRNTYKEVL